MKGNLSALKALQGCETEMRELEGIEKLSVIPDEGSCSLSGSHSRSHAGTHACSLPVKTAFMSIPVLGLVGSRSPGTASGHKSPHLGRLPAVPELTWHQNILLSISREFSPA